MHRPSRPAVAALAALTTVAVAGTAAPGDPVPPSMEHLQWHLGPFIQGSTEQVRDLVNGPLEGLLAKRADRVRQRDQLKAADDAKAAATAEGLRRTSPPFARAEAELKAARSARTATRAGGDAAASLAAEDRVRAAEAAVQGQLDAATAGDPAVAAGRKQAADLQQQVADLTVPIGRATQGRLQMLDALRFPLALPGPPKDGAKGLLPKVKPVKIIDAHSFVGEYVAVEVTGDAKDVKTPDGIKAMKGRGYRVHLLVTGTDTAKLHEREPVDLDHTYQLSGTQTVGRVPCLVAKPVDAPPPTDGLLAVLDDLRTPPAAAGK